MLRFEVGDCQALPSDELRAAQQAFAAVPITELLGVLETVVVEGLRRKLNGYSRTDAATALNEIADEFELGSEVRDPFIVVRKVQEQKTELANFRAAFAHAVGQELERVAPGGRLI